MSLKAYFGVFEGKLGNLWACTINDILSKGFNQAIFNSSLKKFFGCFFTLPTKNILKKIFIKNLSQKGFFS